MDPKADKSKSSVKVVNKNAESSSKNVTKKKHHHTGLKVFLILFLVLLVAPISALYICFFDSGKSTVQKDESFNSNEIFDQAFVTSLDNVAEDEAISFSIGTDTINQVLYLAREDLVKDQALLKEIFTGVELKASDDTFTFMFDFNFKTIFQTRIYLETKLTYGEVNPYGYCLVFTISSVKVGRISGIEWLVSKILPNFLTDETLTSMFSSFGLSFVGDIKNNRIIYPMSNFTSDLMAKFPSEEELFNAALKQLFDANKYGNILTFTELGLQAMFDISRYKENENYQTKSSENGFPWKKNVSDVTQKMIDSGVLGANYTGKDSEGNKLTLHEELFQFLIEGSSMWEEGYADLKNCLKTYGQDKLASEFGIADIDNFDGFVFIETDEPQSKYKGEKIVKPITTFSKNLETQIKDAISQIQVGVVPEYLFKIDETLLSSLIGSSQIIGYNYLIAGVAKDSKYQISPIIISDAYCNILNDNIRFVVEMDFNDYPTVMCVETKFNSFDESTYTLSFKVNEKKYGEEEINDDFKSSILGLLNDSVVLGDSLIAFDKEAETLVINCNSLISDAYKTLIKTYCSTDIEMTGKSLDDVGSINLKLTPKV